MEAHGRDGQTGLRQNLWRIRRRRLWPAYVGALVVVVALAALGMDWGIALAVSAAALGGLDLCISARLYALRGKLIEAVFAWAGVALCGVGVLLVLLVLLRGEV